MTTPFCRENIGNGVFFSSVREEKFKSDRLTVCLVAPLEKENAAVNAIVPFVLRKGCRAYPDFTLLNKKLAKLYGALLDADVTKYGDRQIMHVSIQALDDRYTIGGDRMVEECAELLASVVLEPNFAGDGLFLEKDLELERQYLIDTIESDLNDKRVYAIKRCTGMLFKGEPFEVRRYGTREQAGAITREAATEAWRRLVKTCRVEVVFTGAGDPEPAKEIFRRRFAGVEREPAEFKKPVLRVLAAPLKTEDETMEVAQGKLVMGYRMGAPEGRDEINAARMMSAMFGATPFSKLFINVREKMSLCYYCVSRYDRPTGVMIVDSGVEQDNRRAAEDEIQNQLALMAKGDFSDEELANTVLIMKNGLQTVGDMLDTIEGWYLTRILEGDSLTPEEDAAGMENVTREQVMAAAAKAQLEAVYFLHGEEGAEDE